jgi:predicted MFS family arabinose efflux permease
VSALPLLFALAFLVSVDIRIIAPVLPSIAASLGATPGKVGLAMTSYSLAYGTGQLVYGPLSDRHGRVAVVRLAGLGFSLCTMLASAAGTTWQFVATRLVAGACAGAVIPLTLVFIGDSYPYADRQAALGRFSAVTSAGLAFSASIGGAVAYFVSWRLMLLGYAAVALLPVAAMWRLDPARPARRGREVTRARLLDFLADPRAQIVYLSTFAEGFLLWGGFTYLGALATRRYGLDQLYAGLLIALFGVGTMAGGLLVEAMRRRVSEDALAALGGIAMGVAWIALLPRTAWPVFAAAMLLLGFGFVALHTTLQLRGTELSPTARGTAFSLFAFFLFAGIAIGTAVLGRLVDTGGEDTLLAVCGVGLAVVGMATARFGSRRAP